ncbi:hypothetical protein AQJ43_37065 [Streptomyces avermitilis]|uniref:DUF6545 domain-containing protein n=2 Tax=Streptomyces avermitilis TaxID=33903 RepID=A0A4D4N7C3_STRAX|nr:DUF6545 domain-containing protein [Streptomyces avermitilis]KUN47759.1 hypothetical protein AQJ43_37065 [Streptomyces avermitilis]BAU77514.1 putative membrane protein [Streptomyces avermitilis MA-4680 = NBRC 14893]BBJ56268.1 hypothetical protein SAVMC3_88970 [Streptomyces avermitilis]GDY70183.1 hypothetical protein SAV14893_095760 [Streptomyces avermitilis]GDY80482.1 hypothetical protein SAV31267_099670 [Streptomyces avermitilis]
MKDNLGFYLAGGLLLLACLLKLPALVRARGQDWLLSSICALLLVGSGVLFTSAPQTIIVVNRATGVSNFSCPVVYCALTGFSAASVVLVLNWRGSADKEHTRRLSQRIIAVYLLVWALIISLYVLGDAPVERRTDFDVYYASTPYIREMILLYLIAHGVASFICSRLCWRWSREVHGTMRIGLRALAVGYLMHYAGYDAAKLVAVGARWSGHNWDFLATFVAPNMGQPSALLVAVGFILPLVGRRSDEAIRYWQLGPLARTMGRVQDHDAPSPSLLPLPWWKPQFRLRLTQRQTYISDRMVVCRNYFSQQIWDEARAAAVAAGAEGKDAAVIADAAMIAAAVDTHGTGSGEPRDGHPSADQTNPPAATSDLAQLSRALRTRVVKDVRRRHRASLEDTPV